MTDRIEKILQQGNRNHDLEPPATETDIAMLLKESKFKLPSEYIEFLSTHNGGQGELPVQPCWYELWPAEEVIENNENYEVSKYFSDFLAIGSNQGGELIYIDYRKDTKGNIVSIPLIPSDPSYANLIAKTFDEMISLLGITTESAV